MVSIIDGNKIAQDIRNEVRQRAILLKEQKGIIPRAKLSGTIVMRPQAYETKCFYILPVI